jgi:peptidoglycan-associated lipoprotein
MKMNRFFPLLATVALVLAACGGNEPLPADPNAGNTTDSGGPANPNGIGSGSAGVFTPLYTGETLADRELREENLIVYFEFDRSEIRPEFNAMLAAHAEFLANVPTATVRLEGHADERGSREYNIGLGERRALAVRQVLMLAGASASQVTTVSYGEERPAVFGSDEESYSRNRRVELVYR